MKYKMKVFDIVYGTINIPENIEKILQTPQMQRLHRIKQLGLVYFVIKTATHTRYEHCIGTYHAACVFLEHLQKNSNLSLPLALSSAVKVAALLHDVGHGPFSHTWEHIVKNYVHERNAFPCIDTIFHDLGSEVFPELRENKNFGINLIKALIIGDSDYVNGFDKKYQFIFDILSNKRCGIDVDRWDYLKRDYVYLNEFVNPNMNFDDVFFNARARVDGQCIEYRTEDLPKLQSFLLAREEFYSRGYRLPSVVALESLFCDAVKTLENRVISVNADDMDAFLQFDDAKVLDLIKDHSYYKYLEDVTKLKDSESGLLEKQEHIKCLDKITDINFPLFDV